MIAKIIILIVCLLNIVNADDHSIKWGYKKEDGPAKWPGACKDGMQQSPINIAAADVIVKHMPRMHFIKYNHKGNITITNTGSSIMASGFDSWNKHNPFISGGGLKGKYRLAQWHMHWAQDNADGSEHTMGSLHYPAEIHFVHIKENLTIVQALEEHDGLAVVAVFIAVKKNFNDTHNMAAVEPHLKNILEKDKTSLLNNHRLKDLLPNKFDSFYRYEGSLTTPGCNEAVIWTVLDNPIFISQSQIDELRKIKTVSHNNRPVQKLAGRNIFYRPHHLQAFYESPPDYNTAYENGSGTLNPLSILLVTLFYYSLF
uniref:Carbonic anhydrase n=1 Tax=Rhabditophanes sp. KR3021 TaxID=114890 RepID=A0AC35U8Q1_9BILA